MIKYDDIALDRISSHPLENYYGHIRIMSYNLDSTENFVRVAVDSIMNLVLLNKLQIHQKIKGRINIAGAKINDKSGLYDIDDSLCEDINVVSCALLDTKQSSELFNIEPRKEDFNLFLTILREYSTQCKTALETISESKAMSGGHIISRCRGMRIEKNKNNKENAIIEEEEEQEEEYDEMF